MDAMATTCLKASNSDRSALIRPTALSSCWDRVFTCTSHAALVSAAATGHAHKYGKARAIPLSLMRVVSDVAVAATESSE